MNRMRFLLTLAVALSSVLPSGFSMKTAIEAAPDSFVGLLRAVALISLLGNGLLVVRGVLRLRKPDADQSWPSRASLAAGGTLVVGATFLGVIGVNVLGPSTGIVPWSVCVILLVLIGAPLTVASSVLALSPGFGSLPPVPEPIILPEEEDLGPMIPPEPRLAELLLVKRRLQASGWR